MTLLTIANDIERETGLAVSSTIVGNNNQQARRILASVNRAGKLLAMKDWVVLIKEHTFSTSNNIASYAFPQDFKALIHNTVWNRSQSDPASGPKTPQVWQDRKSGLVSTGITDEWRIKPEKGLKRFYIDPTPSSVETLAYEYLSNSWVKRSGSPDTFFTLFAQDAETSIIDEDVVTMQALWRVLKAMGLSYFDEKDEAEHQTDVYFARDGGATVLDASTTDRVLVAVTPDKGFGA